MRVIGYCDGGPYHGQARAGFSLLGMNPDEWPDRDVHGGFYAWDKEAAGWSWRISWRAPSEVGA